MDRSEQIDGLSECIAQAIQHHLAKTGVAWPSIDSLTHPVLRIEAFLEDGGQDSLPAPRSERIASRTVDLTGFVTPASSRSSSLIPPESGIQPLRGPKRKSPEGRVTQIERHTERQTEIDKNNDTGTSPEVDAGSPERRHVGIGGLRISQNQAIQEDPSEHQRRIQSDSRIFPKRRKLVPDKFVFQPSTLDKLVIGIWEQIHGTLNLDPQALFEQFQIVPSGTSDAVQRRIEVPGAESMRGEMTRMDDSFSKMNVFCRKVTQASRVCRSIEIIVQARWVELFDEQTQLRITKNPERSQAKHRTAIFKEACEDFGWAEKELRNKMAVWRGYKEVKEAAGWAALVFAGMGIYRFCKYRVGFDKEAMRRLQNLRTRLEVAADTLHPNWRRILSVVGESSTVQYPGHPHDWVVFEEGASPVTLRSTYLQNDPYFAFEHVDESIIDETVWGCDDPRWIPQSDTLARMTNKYVCTSCGKPQSDDPQSNSCDCFPKLFGCVKRSPPPIQVFRTPDGRNNGLQALTPFERGTPIGEFVGLITKGVRHLDVMDSSTPVSTYQIWQGRQGNYTRFVNHSCKANAQFQQFTWLDTQRVVLVSKGIEAGTEITVDYSDKYWGGLDKSCLCGESCCRYRREG